MPRAYITCEVRLRLQLFLSSKNTNVSSSLSTVIVAGEVYGKGAVAKAGAEANAGIQNSNLYGLQQ
jgi:hypothetical protein